MSEQDSKKFLEEKKWRQKELIQLKKMQQGVIEAPAYEAVDNSPKSFKEKCRHFWYYYKTYTIAAICLALALSVGVAQCANRPKYDYSVLLLCYTELFDNQTDILTENLAKYGKDLNGDGKVSIELLNCSYDDKSGYNSKLVKQSKLQANLTNSDVILFITDAKAFEYFNTEIYEGFFVTLGLPDDDGRSVLLDSGFYQHDSEGAELPDNLQLRISRRVSDGTIIESKKDTKANIENAEELLYNIAGIKK